jgi:DNA-binding response OmpR family regulator
MQMAAPPLQILLIEDSISDATLMQTRLRTVQEFDFHVEHATRLEEGLTKLSEQKFDVILLDLNLPDSSGLDTVKKTRETTNKIPIIVLTGTDDRSLVSEAIESGADSYMVKDKSDGNRIAVGILWAIRNRNVS